MEPTFRIKNYEIHSKKIKKDSRVRLALLADLHGLVFGTNHQTLYDAILDAGADAVLVAGDLVVGRDTRTYSTAASLVLRLNEKLPVFYGLGNHEYRSMRKPELKEIYLNYERLLTGTGVCFLHNESIGTELHGNMLILHGLELPIEYYHKPNSPRLALEEMQSMIGKPAREGFHILIAHNPKYGKTYFQWGADLTVSGHYHGGVVRLSENYGLSCPQFLILPPYCCGKFEKENKTMIVSAGIGEHTIPLRIHNPRELILIDLLPE